MGGYFQGCSIRERLIPPRIPCVYLLSGKAQQCLISPVKKQTEERAAGVEVFIDRKEA